MEDLIVNFIGATAFSIIGYLYIHNRDKYKFVTNFIPTKLPDNLDNNQNLNENLN